MNIRDALKRRVLGQCPRPFGLLGEYITFRMNRSHFALTTWGLSHLVVAPGQAVLDVGCGGGRTVARLAGMVAPGGTVLGVDISEKCVAVSTRYNKAAVKAGRVTIRKGSVACLPCREDSLDLVTAVETHYFWPDLEAGLAEIRRALKPGGRFLLVGEVYRCDKFEARNRKWLEMVAMPYHSAGELRALLETAGFDPVAVYEETDHGWICCQADKPAD